MKIRNTLLWLLLAIAALLTGCLDGNSSETGNTSVAYDSGELSGKTRPGARVGLYRSDYVPIQQFQSGFAVEAVADEDGNFELGDTLEGSFNFIVVSANGDSGFGVPGLSLVQGEKFSREFKEWNSNGAVGGLAVSQTGGLTMPWTYVYLPGSPFYAYTGAEGRFLIDGVPPGRYGLEFFGYPADMAAAQESVKADVLAAESDSIVVAPGDTTMFAR